MQKTSGLLSDKVHEVVFSKIYSRIAYRTREVSIICLTFQRSDSNPGDFGSVISRGKCLELDLDSFEDGASDERLAGTHPCA